MSISFRSFWSKLDHAENAFRKVSLGLYTGNQRKVACWGFQCFEIWEENKRFILHWFNVLIFLPWLSVARPLLQVLVYHSRIILVTRDWWHIFCLVRLCSMIDKTWESSNAGIIFSHSPSFSSLGSPVHQITTTTFRTIKWWIYLLRD